MFTLPIYWGLICIAAILVCVRIFKLFYPERVEFWKITKMHFLQGNHAKSDKLPETLIGFNCFREKFKELS